jgi:hypothetical protein
MAEGAALWTAVILVLVAIVYGVRRMRRKRP